MVQIMLEKLVKNIGRKITTVLLVGNLLLGSGCMTYNTLSPSSIQSVTPIKEPIERLKEEPIDYDKLTWQEAIEYVQTPEQVQDYLDRHFSYESQGATLIFIPGFIMISKQKGETFRYNHTLRKGSCFDYATSAAALLSDNNYPPLLLTMGTKSSSHSVFLYRTKTGYGALGRIHLGPVYSSIENLVNCLNEKINFSYDKFNIVNLDENYENREWIDGDINLVKNLPFP